MLITDLAAPLADLLASGGDARLALDPLTRLNHYGCRPFPRPEAYTFASSTATSISDRAFAAAEEARQALCRDPLGAVATLRAELAAVLGLEASGAAIVLSPSGTDSELHALAVAAAGLGGPIASILVGADETGSGAVHAAVGRHFSSVTALGRPATRGEPIAGLAPGTSLVPIPLRDADSRLRPLAELDRQVMAAVEAALAGGRQVLLHTMDHSKLGSSGPSLDCVSAAQALAPARVQVVVDACQARISRARLAWHIERGHLVMVTGSKFFTGPPFSGALLVPSELAARVARAAAPLRGLADYSLAADWPETWTAARAGLLSGVNAGQFLRWSGALREMRDYHAVPDHWRSFALAEFSRVVPGLIAARGALSLMAEAPAMPAPGIADGEFALRTMFPFELAGDGRRLGPGECGRLYRALNRDLSDRLPASGRLGAQLCHIGQPVLLKAADGGGRAALRISAGARVVSETWTGEEASSRAALGREFDQIAVILAKLALLLANPAATADL